MKAFPAETERLKQPFLSDRVISPSQGNILAPDTGIPVSASTVLMERIILSQPSGAEPSVEAGFLPQPA
jgi:hypothetical protein